MEKRPILQSLILHLQKGYLQSKKTVFLNEENVFRIYLSVFKKIKFIVSWLQSYTVFVKVSKINRTKMEIQSTSNYLIPHEDN